MSEHPGCRPHPGCSHSPVLHIHHSQYDSARSKDEEKHVDDDHLDGTRHVCC